VPSIGVRSFPCRVSSQRSPGRECRPETSQTRVDARSRGIPLAFHLHHGGGRNCGLPSARPARPIAGIAVLRNGSSASADARHLYRYSYVLLGKGQYRYVARVKRLSPATKVFGYDAAPDLVDDCIPVSWVCPGTTYQEARVHDARYPNDRWILRNESGQSLVQPPLPALAPG
jgi:hypothetical protein